MADGLAASSITGKASSHPSRDSFFIAAKAERAGFRLKTDSDPAWCKKNHESPLKSYLEPFRPPQARKELSRRDGANELSRKWRFVRLTFYISFLKPGYRQMT
jgi:hypothetical protein